MTEPTTEGGLSLLPYLESRTLGLRLTLTDLSAAGEMPLPPLTDALECAGPFTVLWNARITMDGLHALSNVFLLIQPDRYAQAPIAPETLVNPQVEALWQRLAVRLQSQEEGRGPLLLPDQKNPQGQLIALRPLFYCRHRLRYAHPRCPQCGCALTVCRDDQLLQAAGLQAYSHSLRRYLFCPSCQKQTLFYAPEIPSQAPAHLRDARFLVEGFSRLLGQEALADELPCIGCPEGTVCYGPQTLVHQRLAPLCFYPFHMLMLRAPLIYSDFVSKLWLNDLRREIQTLALASNPVPALTAVVPQPVAAQPPQEGMPGIGKEEEDARIAAILQTILSRWPGDGANAPQRASMPPPPQVKMPSAPPPDADGDWVETIILGAAASPSPDMEKTVLIQPPAAAAAKPPPAEDLQATVLISPAGAPGKQPVAQDLEKTVLMRPGLERPNAPPVEELAQTVIMTPPAASGGRPPQAPPPVPSQPAPMMAPEPTEADDLAATIIIAPDPTKGRRSKP